MPIFMEKLRKKLIVKLNSRKYNNPAPIYQVVVSRARHPKLYQFPFLVPNNLDGRFDSLCLHLYLVLRCLNKETCYSSQQRKLIEYFITDMDRTVREIGVGDLSVGRHVTNMAKAFNGRSRIYEQHIDDLDKLARALERNLYATQEQATHLPIKDKDRTNTENRAKQLAFYAQQQAEHLSRLLPDDILNAHFSFANFDSLDFYPDPTSSIRTS